jgi:asparagine synthetase B (glutamine-hydrolysing)
MCGIFGAVKPNGNFNSTDLMKFKNLTELVKYRGPDATGYNTYNTYNKTSDKETFNIFLGLTDYLLFIFPRRFTAGEF